MCRFSFANAKGDMRPALLTCNKTSLGAALLGMGAAIIAVLLPRKKKVVNTKYG